MISIELWNEKSLVVRLLCQTKHRKALNADLNFKYKCDKYLSSPIVGANFNYTFYTH